MAEPLASLLGLPHELPTSFSPTHGWTLSWLLPILACGVLAAYAWASRRQLGQLARTKLRWWLNGLLGVCALLSVVTYADFGLARYGSFINEWDVYHYYLGSKYTPELGYVDLYGATLVADAQTGLQFAHRSGELRDLSTLEFVPVGKVLQQGEHHRRRFTPERWAEFVQDVEYFKHQLPHRKWNTLLRDHGYNGTPAWSVVVGMLFTRNLSIGETVPRILLLSLDPLLIMLALWMVRRAFSLRTALLLTIFIGTHYLFSWGHLKGGILRTDFAMLSLMSICCVKLGHYRTAGAMLAGATLSRVFPVLLLVGPAIHGLDILVRKRRIDRDLLWLAVSFFATLLVVAGAGALYGGGTGLWAQWTEKITQHYGYLVHWNMGYGAILGADWEPGFPELVSWSDKLAEEPMALLSHKLVSGITRVAIVVPALYFARGLRRWESMAYSFVFFFFLLQATYYYYLILVVPLLFFVAEDEVERPERALGAAWMLLTGAAGYLLFAGWAPLRETIVLYGWRQLYPTYYFLSWLICGTCLYMIALAAVRTHAHDAALEVEVEAEVEA